MATKQDYYSVHAIRAENTLVPATLVYGCTGEVCLVGG
jgi:hypothetical protein